MHGLRSVIGLLAVAVFAVVTVILRGLSALIGALTHKEKGRSR